MANIMSLKRRITAAQNVSKTTKAMQMIAASKLKRAQNAALLSRPYSEKLSFLLRSIAEKLEQKFYHDYMKFPENAEKTLLVIFAPDKGLCGALVGNITNQIFDYDQKNSNSLYLPVGKKIERYVSNMGREVVGVFRFGTTLPNFDMVFPLVKIINDYFLMSKVRSVKILYSKFIGVLSQSQEIITLLPIQMEKESGLKEEVKNAVFEPSPQKIVSPLLKHYLEMSIYQALLESYASEQGARMIAMQNATNNAIEITNELKLEYNKTRQEKITNEILDIEGASFSYQYEEQ